MKANVSVAMRAVRQDVGRAPRVLDEVEARATS